MIHFQIKTLGPGAVGPPVRQALRLLADGRYVEAGELFEQLADRARQWSSSPLGYG